MTARSAGREGSKVTSRMIVERLKREAEGNVAIRVSESEEKDAVEVAGRGELQLGVLIETMRREGYELAISRPRVLLQDRSRQPGRRLEPIEEVRVDVDEEYAGIVVDKMAQRKGELRDMRPSGGGKQRLDLSRADARPHRLSGRVPDRHARHRRDEPAVPRLCAVEGRDRGPAHRRPRLERRGRRRRLCAVEPRGARADVHHARARRSIEGMIVGAHTRGNDLEVNPVKGKQLTNIRTTSKDEAVRLTPPILMTLEQAIAYIDDDELVEVTPKSIRLRKRQLDPNARKRASRAAEAEAQLG